MNENRRNFLKLAGVGGAAILELACSSNTNIKHSYGSVKPIETVAENLKKAELFLRGDKDIENDAEGFRYLGNVLNLTEIYPETLRVEELRDGAQKMIYDYFAEFAENINAHLGVIYHTPQGKVESIGITRTFGEVTKNLKDVLSAFGTDVPLTLEQAIDAGSEMKSEFKGSSGDRTGKGSSSSFERNFTRLYGAQMNALIDQNVLKTIEGKPAATYWDGNQANFEFVGRSNGAKGAYGKGLPQHSGFTMALTYDC